VRCDHSATGTPLATAENSLYIPLNDRRGTSRSILRFGRRRGAPTTSPHDVIPGVVDPLNLAREQRALVRQWWAAQLAQ
jgi:hypothetical protein